MRNKYFYSVLFIVTAAVAFTINSCKKEDPDTETTSVTDNSLCEGEFSRFMPAVNHIAVGDSGVQKMINSFPIIMNNCPDHYIDSADIANGFPNTMWLYYGTDADGDSVYEQGCTGNDNKVRAGMIKAVFNAPWGHNGASVDMTLINYFVDGVKYEGTVTVTQTGTNSYTQSIPNGKCTASGWNILWNSSRTITNNMGDTTNPYDDVSMIAGTASGTDRNGKAFSVDINTPLKRAMGCPWIESGKLTLKLEGKKDRTIDYGDGTCDNRAVLSINGNDFEFILK